LRLLKKLSNAGRADREHARPGTPIEVWFQDEMRVGQKNSLVYQWAKKGSRPRSQGSALRERLRIRRRLPSRDTGVALIMPQADTEAMQAHLEAIGRAVALSAHALLILDKAGWHTTRKLNPPSNLTLVPLRQHAPNSTQPRTSGSICARPISPTDCSPTTLLFSTLARTLG